jgi:hypothetical protein
MDLSLTLHHESRRLPSQRSGKPFLSDLPDAQKINGRHLSESRIKMSAQINDHCDSSRQNSDVRDIEKVPIQSILSGDSPRINGEDDEHIKTLAQMGTPLPPILVQRGTMRVIDGMHRLRAANLHGDETIQVRFFDGTDAEAFVAGVKANTEHGLPLTLEDREVAASRILALYPERSDRWVAGNTGLAPGTVSAIRRRFTGGDDLAKQRMGRDGRMRPLDGADGRRMAMETIAEHPDATLREIARMAGISPGTARDVRNRMARGENPVLQKQMPDSDPKGPTSKRRSDGRARRENSQTTASGRSTADPGTLLLKLQRDPSLRLSQTGRELLRWLDNHAGEPNELVDLIEAIPPHCLYLIAELARRYADAWMEAARTLQQQIDDAQQSAD